MFSCELASCKGSFHSKTTIAANCGIRVKNFMDMSKMCRAGGFFFPWLFSVGKLHSHCFYAESEKRFHVSWQALKVHSPPKRQLPRTAG